MVLDRDSFSLSLTEIVDIAQWQYVQDHLTEVIGIPLRTVDLTGALITCPSKMVRLCSDVLPASAQAAGLCGRCLPDFLTQENINHPSEATAFSCHATLHHYALPICALKAHPIAYLLVGPFLLGKRDAPENIFKDLAYKMGLDLEKIADAVRELKLFSYNGIDSVINLLQGVSHYIAQLGYQKIKLQKIAPGIPRLDTAVTHYYLDRVLTTLFEATFAATGAESGSVMVLNPETRELYIHLSKNIDPDIAKHTSVKLGEGIAGRVAQDGKSLFLSDRLEDASLQTLLKRPEIASSIIVPIRSGETHTPMGVVSLGTFRASQHQLTADTVTTIEQLVNLAEIALEGLSKKTHNMS